MNKNENEKRIENNNENENERNEKNEKVSNNEKEKKNEKREKEEEGQTHEAARPVPSFELMNLPTELLRGVYGFGFERPSFVQQRAIVPMSQGLDIIAQSQSGTGKTGAFCIGALARVDCTIPKVQVLVLEPFRELANQSAKTLTEIGAPMGAVIQCSIGGMSVGKDISAYKKGVHGVVGTPGRVLDLIRRGYLSTDALRVLVLDEADEMLSSGFQEAMQDIMREIPTSCQVALFSATLPPETLELSQRFMRDPVRIVLNQDEVNLKGIKQYYVDVGDERYKMDTLVDLFKSVSVSQCIIFCNSRRKADILTQMMSEREFPVVCIHSELSTTERMHIMDEFTRGSFRVLIATDLIARGIDVQGVEFVVNYDLTSNFENYIHRIGRGGRFGRNGVAINFVTARDRSLLKQLSDHYSIAIEPLPRDFVYSEF